MDLSALSKTLLSHLVSITIILMIAPIFTEAFGPLLLSNLAELFVNESKLVFLISMIWGQILFPALSTIRSGMMLLPMFELRSITSKIVESYIGSDGALKNIVFCFLAAGVLSAILCLAISLFGQGKLLAKIPSNVIDSVMMITGCLNVYLGFNIFAIKDNMGLSIVLFVISVVITTTALVILSNTQNPKLLVLFLIALLLLTNSLKKIYDLPTLVENKIFITSEGSKIDLNSFWHSVNIGEIDFEKFSKNLFHIVTLGISPIISFSTTLPFYLKQFNIEVDYNRELLSFGISSLSVFPVSINGFGSILFRMCGANSKSHSVLAGICLIPLIFVYHYVTPLISTFILSLISLFIGFSILNGYIKALFRLTLLDKFVLLVPSLLGMAFELNILIMLLLGICINMLISLYFLGLTVKQSPISFQQIEDVMVVKVRDSLTCSNIQDVVEGIELCKNKVVFDFLDTKYVDYTVNGELEKMIDSLIQRGLSIEIMGRPANLNSRIIKIAASP